MAERQEKGRGRKEEEGEKDEEVVEGRGLATRGDKGRLVSGKGKMKGGAGGEGREEEARRKGNGTGGRNQAKRQNKKERGRMDTSIIYTELCKKR